MSFIAGAGATNVDLLYQNMPKIPDVGEEVYTDETGFAETVRVRYNPAVVSLEFLLRMFFKAIDPTSLNKQGHDEGTRYRTGIYYTDSTDLPIIDKVYADVGHGQVQAVLLVVHVGYRPVEGR